MKKILLFLLCSPVLRFYAQVFNGNGGTIDNSGVSETIFSTTVSGLPALIDSVYGLEEVCIDITHPTVEELHVYLRSPAGVEVELSGMKSCKGSGFVNTCFNNSQLLSVTSGTAPYSGAFRPLGNIGRFNRELPGNGTWQLIIKDFVGGVGQGTLNGWTLKFGSAPSSAIILKSSNLPIVFINTPGGIQLSEKDTLVDFGIIDNGAARNNFSDPRNNYNGKSTCHIRGASSKMFEKNNLKLELKTFSGKSDTIASLVGMPAESDWILTACYTDKTMIRNALSQTLFQSMGHYSPRYRFVELIVNDEYFGVYLLMEQIKRGQDRVDIAKLTTADNTYPEVTGGYILQINRSNDPGWYSLNAGVSANGAKFYYQYEYPRADVMTSQQQQYIKSAMDSFEVAIASPQFTELLSGYAKYTDVNSFVDFMILSELSKNVDAYKLSSYLYKDNAADGGKLHAGPAWDFDLAWHNANFGNAFSETLWQFEHNNSSNPIPTWWRRLMEDPAFQEKLNCRYHSLRQDLLSETALFKFIDETVLYLNESRYRNYKQFPIIGAYVYANPQDQTGATYESEVNDLKDWIHKRGEWLDANIPGKCDITGHEESLSVTNELLVSPNPFSSNFTIRYETSMVVHELTVEILTIVGNQWLHVQEIKNNTGKNTAFLNTEFLPPGTYFVKVLINGRFFGVRKIVKIEGE